MRENPSSKSSWLKKWKAGQAGGSEGEASDSRPDQFQGAPARIIARLSRQALLGNFAALREMVADHEVLPMVKADAYGHGMSWVARTLAEEAGLYGFGVATLAEGAELREALAEKRRRVPVVVFSGACPWSRERGEFCERHGLTPAIADDADWEAFLKQGWPSRISYELKFNTGMNRLGLSASLAPKIARAIGELPDTAKPTGVFTHLAIAESATHKLTQQQLERFVQIRGAFAPAGSAIRFHLANSAGAWNHKELGLAHLTDVIRPGLSLYGIPPWSGAPVRGIEPVMSLEAAVLHLLRVRPGETVGYGARYRVPTTGPDAKPQTVAILGAGYADGVNRQLSGTEDRPGGYVWLGGQEQRMLGTVSMDLCAVSCAPDTRRGERAQLFGPRVDPWAQSRAAGTIPYELLTSIGARVRKIPE